MIKWIRIETAPIGMNTYLLENEKRECLIFDVGGSPKQIIERIQSKNLQPLAIVLTHAHFDHIEGIDTLYETFSLPIYMSKKEKDWLTDGTLNGSQYFYSRTIGAFKPKEIYFLEPGMQQIGSFIFEVRNTPGHSPGSLSFYFEKERFAVTGDALFYGSIGRTDLAYGDHKQLIQSIQEQLLSMSNEVTVLPGHGETTTIGFERTHNPFL